MNKNILLVVIILLSIGGYYLYSNVQDNNIAKSTNENISLDSLNLEAPNRPAEVNGNVISIEGNIIIVANEIGKEQLSEEEREIRKEEMQKLSQEERQAQRQQELESLQTEDIEVVVPVGITITKGSGDASGDNVPAEISEITKGTYVSIWMNENNNPEFIKIKGLGQ